MSASNSTPKARRGVEKYLAANFAIVAKDKQRATVPVEQLKRMEADGWARVN